MWHQRPYRPPLRPERAALTLWRRLCTPARWRSRRPTTTLPSTVTPMFGCLRRRKAEGLRCEPGGQGHRLQSKRRTQWHALSASFNPEPVSMTSVPLAAAASLATASTAASLYTVRKSSVVVVAIKLACAGVAHEARGALSGLSGQRHGRWCHVRHARMRHARVPLFTIQRFGT